MNVVIGQFGGSKQVPLLSQGFFEIEEDPNVCGTCRSSSIEHCELIRSQVSGMSKARHSKLEDARVNGASSVSGSTLLRAVKVNGVSSVTESDLSHNVSVEGASSVGESKLEQGVRVTGASSVSRSKLLEDVKVGGASCVNESMLSQRAEVDGATHVNNSRLQCTAVKRSKVSDSIVMGSVVEDCNVEHCEIERCTFSKRELKYGVWRDNILVGRIREDMEPINREYISSAGVSISLGNGSRLRISGDFGDISIGNMSVEESSSFMHFSSTGQGTVPRLSATRGSQRVTSEEGPANFLPPPKQTSRSEAYDNEII
ncbi:hypothetical protein N7526_002014 [Penicillium atrosanguineum]|nr:hypothetical protein N7526_002014 [Penicillium atrosanguineum]